MEISEWFDSTLGSMLAHKNNGLMNHVAFRDTMQNNKTTPTEVKSLGRFNQSIKIEIEVNTIFDKLMDTFPVDYKHKEILSHAIIGSSVNSGKLGYIYNALSGFTNDIDFQVGDNIICIEEEAWERYDGKQFHQNGEPRADIPVEDNTTEEYKPDWQSRAKQIGEATIVSIDLYATNKLTVKYSGYENAWDCRNGNITTVTTSVDHRKCTKVPVTI